MLRLRPHHLIDIIRNIGQERPIIPHPYGHAQHIVTRSLLEGQEHELLLTVGADDLCKPCIHLHADELCDDVLPQLDYRVAKQEYNDKLDRRLLAYLGLKENSVIPLKDFIALCDQDPDKLAVLSTHPKEDKNSRKAGLEKGLMILRRNIS
jgi:hypothetical protein